MADERTMLDAVLGGASPKFASADMLDKVLGSDDTVPVSSGGGVAPSPKPQPVNEATMECWRGPCRFLWALTSRTGEDELGGKIQLKRIRQCNCHYEPTELADENIYHCSEWWPRWLMFVPLSLQAVLRPHLRKLWELQLKLRGYDFSWKWWKDSEFESDDPVKRQHSGLGFGPGSNFDVGTPTEDGITFNQ